MMARSWTVHFFHVALIEANVGRKYLPSFSPLARANSYLVPATSYHSRCKYKEYDMGRSVFILKTYSTLIFYIQSVTQVVSTQQKKSAAQFFQKPKTTTYVERAIEA